MDAGGAFQEGAAVTESITSSDELRQFATENDGRRKIDVEACLDLHRRAANQIDLLARHVSELRGQLEAATAAGTPQPSSNEDAAQAALLVLQRAQATADQTIAEASRVRAEAEAIRQQADGEARARADAALDEARVEAQHIVDAARIQAAEITNANAQAAERVAEAEQRFRDRIRMLRADAESLVDLTRELEEGTAAATDEPAADEPQVAPTQPKAQEPAPASLATPPDRSAEAGEQQAPALATEPLPPPPPPPPEPAAAAPTASASTAGAPEAAAPDIQFLPPPPPKELYELSEHELEEALEGRSIDDELFGDDVVIDLRDEPTPSVRGGSYDVQGRD